MKLEELHEGLGKKTAAAILSALALTFSTPASSSDLACYYDRVGLRLWTISPDTPNTDDDKASIAYAVEDVLPGSPAARAGFKEGDLIVDYDESNMSTKPGTYLRYSILRNGTKMTVSLPVALIC